MNSRRGSVFSNAMRERFTLRWLPRLFAYVSIYALTIGLASLLWHRPATLALTYVLLSAVLLLKWRSYPDILYFALPAVLGPIGEFVAISFGAWKYSLPLFNIPLWLPLAWGVSGLCLKKIADVLTEARATRSV